MLNRTGAPSFGKKLHIRRRNVFVHTRFWVNFCCIAGTQHSLVVLCPLEYTEINFLAKIIRWRWFLLRRSGLVVCLIRQTVHHKNVVKLAATVNFVALP